MTFMNLDVTSESVDGYKYDPGTLAMLKCYVICVCSCARPAVVVFAWVNIVI